MKAKPIGNWKSRKIKFLNGKAVWDNSPEWINRKKKEVTEDTLLFSSPWKALMGFIFFGGLSICGYFIFIGYMDS